MSTSQEPTFEHPPAVPIPKPGKLTEEDLRWAFSDPYWKFDLNSFMMTLKWLKDECDEALKSIGLQENTKLYTGEDSTYRRQTDSTKKMIFDFMYEGIKKNKKYEDSHSTNLMLGMLVATNYGYRQYEDDGDSTKNWLVRECTNSRLVAWRRSKSSGKDAEGGVGDPAPRTTTTEQITEPRVSTIHRVLNDP